MIFCGSWLVNLFLNCASTGSVKCVVLASTNRQMWKGSDCHREGQFKVRPDAHRASFSPFGAP